MASRLLNSLDAQIAAANSAVQLACLRAQRAIYLARQGHGDESTAIVQDIRQTFAKSPNAEVTAWISLCESLVSFYSHPGPQAMDRLQRAHALSRAMQHPLLQPLCAAWLSHMAFNANLIQPMVEYAGEALRLAQPDHHAALARVSLVIADTLHFAGRFDLAKPWYAAVREHALAEGDDAMISAMMHNIATFKASAVRMAEALDDETAEQAAWAYMEAESIKNYDSRIGTTSLSLFIPLLRAQLLTVQQNYVEARSLFDLNLAHAEEQGMLRLKGCFFADRAWCNLKLGRSEDCQADLDEALANLDSACDPDDLSIAHARVSRVFEALGQDAESTRHRALSQQYLAAHRALQAEWLSHLLPVLPAGAGPVSRG